MTTVAHTRARTATLVVVGDAGKLAEAGEVAGTGEEAGALRVVLISTASGEPPAIEPQPDVVVIGDLKPQYVNNAIAGVRLSSLPTVVWWRGGPAERLDGVASLADRLILDVDDPWPLWERAAALFEDTAMTDIRWTRLTRWRAAMAHFFDLPEVREKGTSFSRLSVNGSDTAQCALFAGWLDTSLRWRGRVKVELGPGKGKHHLESLTLEGSGCSLSLSLMPNSTCVETQADLSGRNVASRVVSLGDQSLPALLSQEFRVRSRDLAFEAALSSTLERQKTVNEKR
jgi:glucose-6-phosphate dehydrogenase assembly protein OpcA